MPAKPVIGLCAALETASWGVWSTPAHLLPREYADAVQRAGGIAVILPPDGAVAGNPDEVLDLLDALILAGGSDVDPGAYGQEAHPATIGTNPERDAFEIALANRAIERDMPFLGICRGMQVLNVARGGTLLQHLPESHGHEDHRRNPGSFEGADHQVTLTEGSLAARAAGEQDHRTLSHHHPAVDAIGDGLVVTGVSQLDDLAEAVELPGSRFVLGVQWHPEEASDVRPFAALVRAATG
jgi:putative glutamine amidotransferase